MSTSPFGKFMDNRPKGAAKKEAIRQDKKKMKKEARAEGDKRRKMLYEKRMGTYVKPPEEEKVKKSYGPLVKGPGGKKKLHFDKNDKVGREGVSIEKRAAANAAQIMPLNKYLAHSGVCGRREAADIIKLGNVMVDNVVITEPGFKVTGKEVVKYHGKTLFSQKNMVYILLNKPKDFITTAKDPQGRKTVFELIKGATPERVFSVGRLDRNTTGVLLLTNDGELTQKLTHPSFEVKKIYEVKLDKPFLKADAEAISAGITLEDGPVHVDSIGYVDPKDKSVIGIEIHSGRNRIVRRIFEHMGYDVKGLDRVMFGNLTKKNVERSHWRFLNEKEVRLLKFMNQSYVRKTREKNVD